MDAKRKADLRPVEVAATPAKVKTPEDVLLASMRAAFREINAGDVTFRRRAALRGELLGAVDLYLVKKLAGS